MCLVVGSEEARAEVGEGQVRGSASDRAMDFVESVFRERLHLELPDADDGEII